MVSSNQTDERLLHVLAEQLKLPLLQIAAQAEAGHQTADGTAGIARAALRMIDGYVLATGTAQTALSLEPVSISATLQDVAHALTPHAKRYDCRLEVQVSGRYGPVMAHQQGLEQALLILGQSFIEAQTEAQTGQSSRVVLATHRSARGLVAGIFDGQEAITADMLRRAKALTGTARQPLTTGSAGNGAGVFVANSLLQLMNAPLQVARHAKLNGLASTFIPSQQLSLVGA
jgi:hypothetical protein